MSKKAKGKDDKKKKEKVIVGPPAEETLNENNKGYYINLVRSLEQQVMTYQQNCEELDVANAENQIKLDRMLDDQSDVVLFIENKLKNKVVEIGEVKDEYKALQEAMVKEEEQFVKQLEAIQQEHKETEAVLTEENETLQKQITDLEEFEKNKDHLSQEIKKLEMAIFNQESEHRDARYLFDKQYRMEKDKLKTELLEQVKLVANEYKKVSNSQLSETCKRTIREMVSIDDKLNKMTKQTTELLEVNDALQEKVAEQKLKIKILEENEKKLIRKHVCNHHTLSLLKAKCQTLEPEVMIAVVETKDRIEELLAEKTRLLNELKLYRSQLAEHQEQEKSYAKEKEKLGEAIFEKNLLRTELVKLILKSANAIEQVIKPEDSYTDSKNGNLEAHSLKREKLLEVLLLLLNSAGTLREPNLLKDSFVNIFRSELRRPFGAMDLDAAEDLEELASNFMPNIPQYKVGHLGLVPQKNIFNLFNTDDVVTSVKKQIRSHYQPFGTRRDETISKYMEDRHTKNERLMKSKLEVTKRGKICTKNSIPRNVEEKRKKLPSLPTKVLQYADELLTHTTFNELHLFPESYLKEKGKKSMLPSVRSTESDDPMWLS